MFTIRPILAALAFGIALLAVLASAHSSNPQAENFAALHHQRCLQQRPAAPPELCAMRTIQLASQLYGMDFADQVAQALE